MKVLLGIAGALLMVPMLLLVAVALGPAALMIAALIGSALLVVGIGDAVLRLTRHTWVPPGHG